MKTHVDAKPELRSECPPRIDFSDSLLILSTREYKYKYYLDYATDGGRARQKMSSFTEHILQSCTQTFWLYWKHFSGSISSCHLRLDNEELSSNVVPISRCFDVHCTLTSFLQYRAEKKSLQILLSSTQAGPGRKVKQEQEEISRNHVPRLFLGSVHFPLIVTTLQFAKWIWFVWPVSQNLQSWEKVLVRGCEKFLPALA